MKEDTESPKAVVISLMAAWSQGWDKFVKGFDGSLADDCVYANVGFPTWHGRAQIMDALQATREEFGLDKIIVQYKNVLECGEHVVVERMEHWFDEKGQPLFPQPEPAMGIFTVRNGKIAEYRDYFDPRTFLKMLERKNSKSKAFFA